MSDYQEQDREGVGTVAGAYKMIRNDVGELVNIQAKPTMLTDGFHTMEQLYDHRRALTAVVAAWAAKMSEPAAWRSKAHHPDDSPMFEGGYFIVGIELDTGTITYHYKLKHWDDFTAVPELEHAPKWDGATPDDSVTRLLRLAQWMAGPFQ